MTMIEWIGASLRDHPELALFLALAAGLPLAPLAGAVTRARAAGRWRRRSRTRGRR